MDGPDNRFGQINVPTGKIPLAEASIQGFEPTKRFKVPANYIHVKVHFYWPSLQDLNKELNTFPWMAGEQDRVELQGDSLECVHVMHHGPPHVPPLHVDTPPSIPAIGTLATAIMRSSDKLSFILY